VSDEAAILAGLDSASRSRSALDELPTDPPKRNSRVIARKYRGTLRIVPIRALVATAVAAEDSEALFAIERTARLGGFKDLADEVRAVYDKLIGIERCPKCGFPIGQWVYGSKCRTCRIRHDEIVAERGRARRVPIDYSYLEQRHSTQLPWTRAGKGRKWTLQRSWRHLRGRLPDPNYRPSWTSETYALERRLIKEELARRVALVLEKV